jgi:hypothetical protein
MISDNITRLFTPIKNHRQEKKLFISLSSHSLSRQYTSLLTIYFSLNNILLSLNNILLSQQYTSLSTIHFTLNNILLNNFALSLTLSLLLNGNDRFKLVCVHPKFIQPHPVFPFYSGWAILAGAVKIRTNVV